MLVSTLSTAEDIIITDLADAMKFKFMVHREKGDWMHKTHDQLYGELVREIQELKTAKTKEAVISECADIANYCAMIIDLAKRKGIK